ncbi:cupredoxin domain-containing protein [Amycolatopsis pithecellobii]|uniref:Copper-binding protein n=1 Tax=Amycolatopsis pithecellobii TaxID=664692 RepID=A0A6N7Z926_9PSEU|nr:cupredoxin family copper-binding protein [Amycolatopsis pithecellobii]MTD57826.1 copper-binding protein [Amycolatopsis pithecellobii]
MRTVRLLMAAVLGLLGLMVFAPPASAATQPVMMESYAFSPSALTVHVGDTVTWTNHDQAPHDVTTTSAPVAIKSPMLSTGQSFSYTFTTAGTYSYYCSIHPDMRAQVIVQPVPAPVPAPVVTSAPKTTTQRKPAGQASSAPQAVVPALPPSAMSMPAGTSVDSAPAVAPTAVPAQAEPAVAAGVTPTTTTTLDPMLIVAGLAAGVAVLCLLILGSRRET